MNNLGTVEMFDVQANGDLLVMTTTHETQTTFSLGNFTNSKVEPVLSIEGSNLRSVAIHPTKRFHLGTVIKCYQMLLNAIKCYQMLLNVMLPKNV